MSSALIQMCLAQGIIDGPLLARLLSDHALGFDPVTLECDALGTAPKPFVAGLTRMAAAGAIRHARIGGAHGEELELSGLAGRPADQLIWRVPSPPSDLALVDSVCSLPGFTAAYLADADDAYWQSEDSLAAYELHGRDHRALPKVSGGFFPGEDESIDVTVNPGRQTPFDGMWLFAASKMWFGPPAFSYLDRERLLALGGEIVDPRADGTVFVDLFPYAWYREDTRSARAAQSRFREALGLDELETLAPELEARIADPKLDVQTSGCTHGGARRIVEWLDATGNVAVRRSTASRVRVTELSEVGTVVWREEGPA